MYGRKNLYAFGGVGLIKKEGCSIFKTEPGIVCQKLDKKFLVFPDLQPFEKKDLKWKFMMLLR